jgi:hypothetical protein
MTTIINGSSPSITFSDSTTQTTAYVAAGSVIQVVNATYNTSTSTSSTSFVATGLSVSITPKFVTSKILIFVSAGGMYKNGNNTAIGLAIAKAGTAIFAFEDLGSYTNSTAANSIAASCMYLDSPATTSSTSYSLQFKNSGGGGNVLIANYNTTAGASACTITLMEIAQ